MQMHKASPALPTTSECRDAVLGAWQSLLMVRRRVLDAVTADLKAAGQPPLDVCLALIQLASADRQRLRPVELERRLETPQYTMSRLLDRMEKSGLIAREPCPGDGRGHHAGLTERGRAALEEIMPVYTSSIERNLGGHFCDASAGALAELLDRIGGPTSSNA